MTARPACTCGVDIDAMRLTRAEDHRSCARLAARVKELEAEVASLRHARDHWMAKAGEQADAVMRAHGMLAEGTRDETAALRCVTCRVPLPPPWATTCEACSR